MANHTDSSYRLLFSQPLMVEDLLKGYVHQPWVQQLDFSTLEPVKTDHLSDRLNERRNDCLWRLKWANQERWLYVYIMLEFQSRPDYTMAVRMLTYLGLLYQHLYRSNQIQRHQKLPPVLPLVLYNGERPWHTSTNIRPLIDLPPHGLESYLPQFEYLLIDEKDYENDPLPEARNLVSALFALENSDTPQDVQHILPLLIDWLHHPEQQDIKKAFAVWMNRAFLPGRMKGVELETPEALEEIQSMLAERVKRWTKDWERQSMEKGLQEGMEKGLQQGLEKGMEQGMDQGLQQGLEKGMEQGLQQGLEKGMEQGMQQGLLQGERTLLARQLEHRFGTLPNPIKDQLNQASPDQLEQWGKNLFDATTLAEVFKP